ncbi:Uncharacterised protein [Pandoraea pulmonicola]|uniref:Uncharacterized protein n=1 Tax=Pandoraea pulmonicola TaxID=93221 RepID=A0AAJ5CZF6_PANPU|nr:Uncharacterised protein [Pandoraea pulmonicola]
MNQIPRAACIKEFRDKTVKLAPLSRDLVLLGIKHHLLKKSRCAQRGVAIKDGVIEQMRKDYAPPPTDLIHHGDRGPQ